LMILIVEFLAPYGLLSRILYGARISLTIGLIGISISFVLCIVIGGLAGYRGGIFDLIVQRHPQWQARQRLQHFDQALD
ncbi:hypothetical protein AB9F46_36100, partial [Rhizobium leguminosarum]